MGNGASSISLAALITNPGVQNPHCTPPADCMAACTGCRVPSAARPSTVTTSVPSARAAGVRQASTARPLRCTVQAPHSPSAQPSLVPVRPSSSRSQSSSVAEAAPAARRGWPLTTAATSSASVRSRRGPGRTGLPEAASWGGEGGQAEASVPAASALRARSTATFTVRVRYRAVARRSSIGSTPAAAASATSAAASSRRRPRASSAAAGIVATTGPTLPRARVRSCTDPSGPKRATAAAWTTEMA